MLYKIKGQDYITNEFTLVIHKREMPWARTYWNICTMLIRIFVDRIKHNLVNKLIYVKSCGTWKSIIVKFNYVAFAYQTL